ncbi:MAG: DUF4105 domain-containing protein [Bacteroidaceae bacterium]|nr:DUF4105 domain-containing protein [Bacteroidaceae bacterium]
MKIFCKHVLIMFCGIFCFYPLSGCAEELESKVKEFDENFVIASLCVVEPAETPISCMGHAFLRMQCSTYDMDYCFSYEIMGDDSEVFRFLSGSMTMRFCRIPTDTYYETYRSQKREIAEFELMLPISVKQNLWRILDQKYNNENVVPYDFEKRGCAYSLFCLLNQALDTLELNTEWPAKYEKKTRRELAVEYMGYNTWRETVLSLIFSGSLNDDVNNFEKVIIPGDLADVLAHSTVCGRKVIDMSGRKLPPSHKNEEIWFSPVVAALLLLLLTFICAFLGKPYMTYTLLGLQTIIGCLVLCTLLMCKMPFTEWNWYIIPFNPLPAMLWKWHRIWKVPFGSAILVWIVAMLLAEHRSVDPPMLIFAGAISASYLLPGLIGKLSFSRAKTNQ